MDIYSSLSQTLTKKITKAEKKDNGIYFTPPTTVKKNIEYLKPYMKDTNMKEVLEPSCGSCEYLLYLSETYKHLHITGIELNKTIFESIKSIQNSNIKLYNCDYLAYESDKKYDLIIGNPPYFVMKKKNVNNYYWKYFDGRPNIFILFIIKSLKLLNLNGILSFVLPKNFLNCLYYDKTRKYIVTNFQILNIIECNSDYIETRQETIILILQNIKPKADTQCNYYFTKDIFTIYQLPNVIDKLNKLYNNSTTLYKLGFNVTVGNIVWNQCKKELTDDASKTLLVYSSNIRNNKLEIVEYSNVEKKNYIDRKGLNDPLLVINRGYGVGKYKFNYCLINENDDNEYLIENHLICIKPIESFSREELIQLYKKIIKSFEDDRTSEFIKLYFGNNAINTTELCKILPIYDI